MELRVLERGLNGLRGRGSALRGVIMLEKGWDCKGGG